MRRSEHSIVRDAALRRLGDVNRVLLVGSVVLTGLLTDVAANAFPGRSPASLKRAAERATAAANERTRAHAQCHVCAHGRTVQQSSTESNSGGGCHVCAPGRTVPQSTAAPAPAPTPAPAPAPAPAPVVVSGGS